MILLKSNFNASCYVNTNKENVLCMFVIDCKRRERTCFNKTKKILFIISFMASGYLRVTSKVVNVHMFDLISNVIFRK